MNESPSTVLHCHLADWISETIADMQLSLTLRQALLRPRHWPRGHAPVLEAEPRLLSEFVCPEHVGRRASAILGALLQLRHVLHAIEEAQTSPFHAEAAHAAVEACDGR
jgi:hypothetical protein